VIQWEHVAMGAAIGAAYGAAILLGELLRGCM
jgi:hypothetical protein